MTAKEFVLIHRPKMRSEKQKIVGFNARTYWLIREVGNSMYFSEGTTESKAWKAAKEMIIESQKEG